MTPQERQNLLIAICLALASTLKISNGIKAMIKCPKANDAQIVQNSKVKWTNKQTTKPNQPEQIQQQKPKDKVFKRTHIKTLQLYVQDNKITTLEEKEYQNFLIEYIHNNPAIYLALLIQANYKLIQFPDNIEEIDPKINYTSLYNNLATNNYTNKYPYHFLDLTTQIPVLNCELSNLQRFYKTQTQPLYPVEQILNILFNPEQQGADYNTRIESLKASIEQFKQSGSLKTSYPYNYILMYLWDIACLLHDEANDLTEPTTQEQLNGLATQIDNFLQANVDKQGIKIQVNKYTNTNEDIKDNHTKIEEAAEKATLQKEEEEMKQQEKAQDSKLSSTQKILNKLSATNNKLQIIMQILY